MAIHVMSPGRCLALALAVAASASACARPPSNEHERNPAMSGATQTGRTLNGHTYTDAPVDVKLGPTTFRFPANYLDSQIAPWPGEGVTLVIEWPDMKPTAPGARADPRTNDFRKEISVRINYVDRVPVEGLLERYASNESITEAGSLEREDSRERLDLRTALPEMLGLTPYAIDEARMVQYVKLYQERGGAPPPFAIQPLRKIGTPRGRLMVELRASSSVMRRRISLMACAWWAAAWFRSRVYALRAASTISSIWTTNCLSDWITSGCF